MTSVFSCVVLLTGTFLLYSTGPFFVLPVTWTSTAVTALAILPVTIISDPSNKYLNEFCVTSLVLSRTLVKAIN